VPISSFMRNRRQQFLSQDMYEATKRQINDVVRVSKENLSTTTFDSRSYSVQFEMIYLERLWLLMLEYTAGCGLADMSRNLDSVIIAFEEWNSAYQVYLQKLAEKHPDSVPYSYIAAPEFAVLGDFQDAIQLLSICMLLRRRDCIARIISILRSHRGQDKLYEALISPYTGDEYSVDACTIPRPYGLLAEAFDEADDVDILAHVKNYLKAWYPAMSKHPRWYNAHLKVAPEGWANYYGYWAFEAGAAIYLLDVSDQTIDSIVYPRDLVEYAIDSRNREEAESVSVNAFLGRVEGGSLCPRSDYWESPARANSRRSFKAGEVMPISENAEYGATIWHWSTNQML
jgi:Domain of unknown function (DUF1911)